MPSTPTYGLPYQSLTDPPDGPSLGEDLALAVETELVRIDGDIAAFGGPFGIPAAPITTSSNGTATSGTTETVDAVLGTYTFTAVAGVRYRVTLSGRGINQTAANDRFSLKLRYTTNGATPTSASTLLEHDSAIVNGVSGSNGVQTVLHVVQFVPGAATVKVVSSWQRLAGTGTATPTGVCSLWAEAIGTV